MDIHSIKVTVTLKLYNINLNDNSSHIVVQGGSKTYTTTRAVREIAGITAFESLLSFHRGYPLCSSLRAQRRTTVLGPSKG